MKDKNTLDALTRVARNLLDKWDAYEKYDTLEEALKYSIGLGGGSSFWPERDDFWFYRYYPNFTIELRTHESENILIPRKQFMKVSQDVWNEIKHNQKQLKLFEE